jgi:hypothetical protein
MASPPIPSFDEYLDSLSQMSDHVDPTIDTAETLAVKAAADNLGLLKTIDASTLTDWVASHPEWVPVLGLAVGLTQERLKNSLKDEFGTSGWVTLARDRPARLVEFFESRFDLIALLELQRHRMYSFGDVLVARAGSRVLAVRASGSGRRLEDEIERVAENLGLASSTRTRFEGRNGRTAPCDLVVPSAADPLIVVAAKAFDSTGSKLTDAVREIEEMADVRQPRQHVMAVIDGIGWKSRQSDLRKIYNLWATNQIDGLYTLRTLSQFRSDLESAARRHGLLP